LRELPEPTTDFVDTTNGWLSPEGVFYECQYHEHDWYAHILRGDNGDRIEYMGWIALRGSYWDPGSPGRRKRGITQAQYNTIAAWYQANDGREHIRAFPAGAKVRINADYLRMFDVDE
jgi:hypothetical protein